MSATRSKKPILFSGPMVRAILEGRKTQTRRIVTPQPVLASGPWGGTYLRGQGVTGAQDPPHPVGSEMWVRETWCDGYPGTRDPWLYRATYKGGADHKWKPSIFMSRRTSRITLRVTDVRMERLQDISESDAIAEGLSWVSPTFGVMGLASSWSVDPSASYRALWESINGPGSWDANPWVWVYTFNQENARHAHV